MNVSGRSKLWILGMFVTVGLIQGCQSEVPPPLPPASPVTPSATPPPDAAKVKRASGPGSSAAQDSTIIGTGKK